MSSKLLKVSTIVVAFVAGYIVSYVVTIKSHMDSMLRVENVSIDTNNQNDKSDHNSTIVNDTKELPSNQSFAKNMGINNKDGLEKNKGVSKNDYTLEQAQAIINDMPDYVVAQYVDKFMAKEASDIITDKRRFTERAVEELYKPNDNKPLFGEIKLSLHPAMPKNTLDTSTINKDAKLYAHLDVSASRGQLPASPYVFIKWVNNQTGQVLLFEQKSIIANSDQNWVSFKPDDGWQVGSYDIRFYQFTSELQPIAQLTYNIYSVKDIETSQTQMQNENVSSNNTRGKIVDMLQ